MQLEKFRTQPHAELFGAPEYPPLTWFEEPTWIEPGQGLTILDSGQFAAYFAMKDTCIIDGSKECWTAPPSASKYAAFHQQSIVTKEGVSISVGVIGNTGGHAGTRRNREALAFYQNPNLQLLRARAGDNEFGSWVAGALLPHLTFGDVDLIRRCALSGHWEWFNHHPTNKNLPWPAGGQYDCLGPTLVNRPGLPLAIAASVGGHPGIFGTNVEVCDCEDEMPDQPSVRHIQPLKMDGPQIYVNGSMYTKDSEPTLVLASVIGDTDLPLVESEWDESAARDRVEQYATNGDGEVDLSTYSRGFFFVDEEAEGTGAYDFLFADFVDEELVAVRAGVEAAQSAAQASDLSDEDKAAIDEKANAYLGGAGEEDMPEMASIGYDRGWYVQTKTRHRASSRQAALEFISHPSRLAAIEGGGQFEALLLVEGMESSDGRTIEKATWRQLPLTLFAQTMNAEGHDEAQIAGRIDEIEIIDGSVMARGVFDSGEFGQEIERLVGEQTLRGISIDIGDVSNARTIFPEGPDEATMLETMENGGEIPWGEPVKTIFGEAEIMYATLVAGPAFADSQIWLKTEPMDVAAALARKVDFLVEERVNETIAKMDIPKLPPTRIEREFASLGEGPKLPVTPNP